MHERGSTLKSVSSTPTSAARPARRSLATLVAMVAVLAACSDSPVAPGKSVEPPRASVGSATPASSLGNLIQLLKDVNTIALGKSIFEDQNLSIRKNQSCASCHDESYGWSAPIASVQAGGGVMPGSIPGRFATRRPPTVSYATPSPLLHYDAGEDTWEGGNFFDGRATGQLLGMPSADQALNPFIGPGEMALPDAACVVYRVSVARYGILYRLVWGRTIDGIKFPRNTDALCAQEGTTIPLSTPDRAAAMAEYNHVALSIAGFEDSRLVNQFTSKYDWYLRGLARLTSQERQGLALFNGKAGCNGCHLSDGNQPLFTDYTFDNIGVPANPQNPNLAVNPSFRDEGLGAFLETGAMGSVDWQSRLGAQKVPTLRNIDKRPTPGAPKSFMHNGSLKSLDEVVHFYNTRDVLPPCAAPSSPGRAVTCWPVPEVLENVNRDELGNLGLTPKEEAALVAFLRTLTDGYFRN